jgi:hypothetical protein
MSIQEVSAEALAELFHHYHQALGQDFGCNDVRNSESWQEVPQPERSRMVAAIRLALLEMDSSAEQRDESRRYFAKPGEAEWGC